MKKACVLILLLMISLWISAQVRSDEKVNPGTDIQKDKPTLVWVKYDFKPGSRVIFEDNHDNEINGEFPSRWEIIKGLGIENAEFDNNKVIYFRTGEAYIVPLVSNPRGDYLPDQFTIEFDAWFEAREYCYYYLKLYDARNQSESCNLITIAANAIYYKGVGGSTYPGERHDDNLERSYWRHLSLSFNGRGLKIYLDDTRLINIPNINCNPTGFTIGVPSFNSAGTKGINRFIRNIRIAEVIAADNTNANTTYALTPGQETAIKSTTTDVLAGREPVSMADKNTINNALNPVGEVTSVIPRNDDFVPGELFMSDARPKTWNIEWNSEDGLDFMAYASLMRAPYIQDVTSNSATVMWRVSIPKGRNPADFIRSIRARAWIAPFGRSLTEGELYQAGSANNSIEVYDVSGTYKYEEGVRYNHDVSSGSGKNDFWLNTMSYRPVIGLKVVFRNLQPSTAYHYRIISEGILTPSQTSLSEITLANDVAFRTTPASGQNQPVSFIAMGDLGPGNENWPGGYSPPSFFYDVFDLFNKVVRDKKPDMWLALGDIDNDSDGHPNAMDPFFFNLYNAYHDQNNPGKTSSIPEYSKTTGVKAFRKPPYTGILGGLPVYPTFGNHDICHQWDGSLDYFNKAYKGSFQLPAGGWNDASRNFNLSGAGYFYTFRYGNVIFISLGLPSGKCTPEVKYMIQDPKYGTEWMECWGSQQKEALRSFLSSLQGEIRNTNTWLVVYFHDHNPGYVDEDGEYSRMLAEYGVDLVLMGHDHTFRQKTVNQGYNNYRALVIGNGGYGDDDNDSDNCHYPGFVFFNISGNTLEYWKYDTHRRSSSGVPASRDDLDPRIWEHCRIQKTGSGQHIISEEILNSRVE
ncbi:MAG TPA: metallophosphoesterase [Bacteroidales bacterium]|nr:hypothetical protein [Bacteroidales bacterium]OQB59919.1 MAG: hypothetical protein BWX96_02485 [Bacteroidetes bacterium ADurb.Bin145]HOU03126.1 metallophosphoesterase [Bacteroidales bacterium]HQG63279.1 metallophosphoesterase [Bacteroidales bacterium]HQK69033.1 metallophosphoesterase [Bacteroidales bacterium]